MTFVGPLVEWWRSLTTDDRIQLVSASANVLLFAATLVYVGLTRGMVLAEREARVVARVVPHDRAFNVMVLEIGNIGKSLARDVQIRFSPDVEIVTQKHLGEVLGTISLLQPGEQIQTVLYNAIDEKRRTEMFPDETLELDVSWRDDSSRRVRRAKRYVIRVDQHLGLAVLAPPTPWTEILGELREEILLLLKETITNGKD